MVSTQTTMAVPKQEMFLNEYNSLPFDQRHSPHAKRYKSTKTSSYASKSPSTLKHRHRSSRNLKHKYGPYRDSDGNLKSSDYSKSNIAVSTIQNKTATKNNDKTATTNSLKPTTTPTAFKNSYVQTMPSYRSRHNKTQSVLMKETNKNDVNNNSIGVASNTIDVKSKKEVRPYHIVAYDKFNNVLNKNFAELQSILTPKSKQLRDKTSTIDSTATKITSSITTPTTTNSTTTTSSANKQTQVNFLDKKRSKLSKNSMIDNNNNNNKNYDMVNSKENNDKTNINNRNNNIGNKRKNMHDNYAFYQSNKIDAIAKSTKNVATATDLVLWPRKNNKNIESDVTGNENSEIKICEMPVNKRENIIIGENVLQMYQNPLLLKPSNLPSNASISSNIPTSAINNIMPVNVVSSHIPSKTTFVPLIISSTTTIIPSNNTIPSTIISSTTPNIHPLTITTSWNHFDNEAYNIANNNYETFLKLLQSTHASEQARRLLKSEQFRRASSNDETSLPFYFSSPTKIITSQTTNTTSTKTTALPSLSEENILCSNLSLEVEDPGDNKHDNNDKINNTNIGTSNDNINSNKMQEAKNQTDLYTNNNNLSSPLRPINTSKNNPINSNEKSNKKKNINRRKNHPSNISIDENSKNKANSSDNNNVTVELAGSNVNTTEVLHGKFHKSKPLYRESSFNHPYPQLIQDPQLLSQQQQLLSLHHSLHHSASPQRLQHQQSLPYQQSLNWPLYNHPLQALQHQLKPQQLPQMPQQLPQMPQQLSQHLQQNQSQQRRLQHSYSLHQPDHSQKQ